MGVGELRRYAGCATAVDPAKLAWWWYWWWWAEEGNATALPVVWDASSEGECACRWLENGAGCGVCVMSIVLMPVLLRGLRGAGASVGLIDCGQSRGRRMFRARTLVAAAPVRCGAAGAALGRGRCLRGFESGYE